MTNWGDCQRGFSVQRSLEVCGVLRSSARARCRQRKRIGLFGRSLRERSPTEPTWRSPMGTGSGDQETAQVIDLLVPAGNWYRTANGTAQGGRTGAAPANTPPYETPAQTPFPIPRQHQKKAPGGFMPAGWHPVIVWTCGGERAQGPGPGAVRRMRIG